MAPSDRVSGPGCRSFLLLVNFWMHGTVFESDPEKLPERFHFLQFMMTSIGMDILMSSCSSLAREIRHKKGWDRTKKLVLSRPFYLCAEYTVDIFLGQAD